MQLQVCTQFTFLSFLYYMANNFFLYIDTHKHPHTTDNKCLYLFRFEFFLFSLLLILNWRNEKSKKEKYKKKVWEECEKIFFFDLAQHEIRLDDLRFEMKLSTRQENVFLFFHVLWKTFFLQKIFPLFFLSCSQNFSPKKRFSLSIFF